MSGDPAAETGTYSRKATSWPELVAGVKNGNPRALARLITRVENRDSGWQEAMRLLYPDTGSALVVGVTGSPGAGKSSLTNKVALGLAAKGFRVGIIAVDPSSPFSGGALLGDRLRMRDIATTEGIFIRSMATRGTLGGLCQAARDVVRILDASGKDFVLIETVGVGQDEIEVVKAAELVVVVCVPGLGDGIQTLKAGIMEIADLFVVNKADREGADEVVSDIEAMLKLAKEEVEGGGTPPVRKTSALTGEGIPELVETLVECRQRPLRQSRGKADRIREEILTLMEREIVQRVQARCAGNGALESAVRQVASGQRDPYSAAREILSVLRIGVGASENSLSSTSDGGKD